MILRILVRQVVQLELLVKWRLKEVHWDVELKQIRDKCIKDEEELNNKEDTTEGGKERKQRQKRGNMLPLLIVLKVLRREVFILTATLQD